MSVEKLITDNIDIWTSAVKTKSASGRGSSKKLELYGVKKLRELILELAVRGKLVPQDSSDEPASVLLEHIAEEKAQLVKEKKIKKQKQFSKVADEEVLFDLPCGWEWTRLAELAEIGPRNNDVEDDIEVSFVPMPLVSTSYKGEHSSETRVWREIKKGYTHFADGDIAIAKITPCFENSKAAVFSNLVNGIGAGTTELHVARPIADTLNPLFVLLYLKAPMFLKIGETKMTGSAGQKRVPKDFFAGNPLPFPPLAEQHRIVATVDELMALCDQLEQQTEASIEAHQVLVTTLLDTLTNSANANELMQNWARISEHFDTLFTTEASIDQLKQTILQLAVMGKLVPQDPNDEPASKLLERISEEKAQLIKDKKIKKQKALLPITDEEKPFELPNGWCFACIGTVSFVLDPNPSHRYPSYENGTVPLLSTREFSGIDSWDAKGAKLVPESFFDYQKEICQFGERDIIFARKGRLGLARKLPSIEKFTFSHTVFVVKPSKLINENYLLWFLRREQFIQDLLIAMNANVGVPTLGKAKLETMPFPIPPLNEQYSIVDKVEELMVICDKLKVRLKESQATQLHLTDAIVEQAV